MEHAPSVVVLALTGLASATGEEEPPEAPESAAFLGGQTSHPCVLAGEAQDVFVYLSVLRGADRSDTP